VAKSCLDPTRAICGIMHEGTSVERWRGHHPAGALIVGDVTVPVFRIRSMTAADARAVAAWRYPGDYSFYDADADAGDLAELLNPAGWGHRYFAADGKRGMSSRASWW
jgi:hypothetical protein